MDINKIWFISLITWLFIYLWLDQVAIYIFAVLMVIDFFVALLAKFVTKEKISLDMAIIWLVKKITKFMVPFVIALIFKASDFQDTQATASFITTIISMLIIFEWVSILGHIYSIHTGKTLPDNHAFEKIIEKIFTFLWFTIEWEQSTKSSSTTQQWPNQISI